MADRSVLARMASAIGRGVGRVFGARSMPSPGELAAVTELVGRALGGDRAQVERALSAMSSSKALMAPATEKAVERIAFQREPPIQLFTTYSQVADVTSVVEAHRLGFFQLSSFLVEQMLQNPRLRGIVNTRLAGLIGTAIRWEPSKQNDLARRAVRALEEDWPQIVTSTARKQLHEWGLMLGAGFAQKHWYRSPSSGRYIPRVEVFHPSWTAWNWGPRVYQVWTQSGIQWVPSPSLMLPGQRWPEMTPDVAASMPSPASPLQWLIHEPFGQHSWRRGLLFATWSPWLAHEWARRDMARAAEKLGLAILLAKYPKLSKDEPALQQFLQGLQNLSSEGIVPLEQRENKMNFELDVLEFGGVGYDMIHRTKDSNATDLAVLWLGHNLTTEAKGGSYAAANVGDLIRGDLKSDDAQAECGTMHDQVLGDWAEVNFGDREVAPIGIYETDPPAINLTAAQTLQAVATALSTLANVAPWVDFKTICARFRIPTMPDADGKPMVRVPMPPGETPPPPATQATVDRVVAQFQELAAGDRGKAIEVLEAWIERTLDHEEMELMLDFVERALGRSPRSS